MPLSEWIPKWARGKGWDESESAGASSEREDFYREAYDAFVDHYPRSPPKAPESLENYYGSPSGSRASSIAGDRALRFALRLDIPDSRDHHEPPRWRRPKFESVNNSMHSIETSWETGALSRPMWEPPILDYRKFEEEGRMYDSLHRHVDTNPEQWYAYTDPEIERELLDDYHDFANHAQDEARAVRDWVREEFYADLRQELDVDRAETGCELGDVKERMYWQQRKGRALRKRDGHRVQEQFDDVRKRWFDVDSVNTKWDEDEWRIFGNRSEEKVEPEGRVGLTEDNLRNLARVVHGKKENDPPSSQRLVSLLRRSPSPTGSRRRTWLSSCTQQPPTETITALVQEWNAKGEFSPGTEAPTALLRNISTSAKARERG